MDGISTNFKNVEEYKGLENLSQIRRTHKTGNRSVSRCSSRGLHMVEDVVMVSIPVQSGLCWTDEAQDAGSVEPGDTPGDQ